MTLTELKIQIIQKLLVLLRAALDASRSVPIKPMPKAQLIYQKAKESVGKHMTLNEAVPASVGCMEAVSAVLALAGIQDGPTGIPGTYTGYEWLKASPLFQHLTSGALQPGDIVMYYTGSGNGSVEGHVLICGDFNAKYPNDWTLLSNQSSSGLFLDQWSVSRAKAYYEGAGGMPRHVFRAV